MSEFGPGDRHDVGKDGWQPTPRPADPVEDHDAVQRLEEKDRLDTPNPKNLEDGPDEEDVEEHVVEEGVEETKDAVQREWQLTPHHTGI